MGRGIDYGLVFGGSKTVLHGSVRNIQRASDVAGVYAAAGAGLALGRGVRAIVLTNQNGAILELSGQQIGLMANADLSGVSDHDELDRVPINRDCKPRVDVCFAPQNGHSSAH